MTVPAADEVPGAAPARGSATTVAELLAELLAMVDRDELVATPAERGFLAGALAAQSVAAG